MVFMSNLDKELSNSLPSIHTVLIMCFALLLEEILGFW